MGGVLGDGSMGNLQLLYEAGKKIGLAFQMQDDYLDAFGDPAKFGKQVGGDILANKKTFLVIHALETASVAQRQELKALLDGRDDDKVNKVLQLFEDCGVRKWALELKNKFQNEALQHIDDIAIVSKRKQPIIAISELLVKREY